MFFNHFLLTATSELVLLIPVVLIVFTILVVLIVLVMFVVLVVLMVLVMFVVLVMLVVLARLVMLMVLAGLRLVYDNHSFWIPGVDVVYVGVVAPAYRLIEVISLAVASPLAVAHHAAQLLVAILPCPAV